MQDKVKIIEVRSYAPENEKGWGGIESENGEEKWISLDYVTKLDIPFTVKVDTDNVGVYKEPGSNS